jgi:hypothetical protein
MTVLQAFIALLVVALLVYALMYVGWLPRPRRSTSSAGTFAGMGNPEKAQASVAQYSGEGNDAGRNDVGRNDVGRNDVGRNDVGRNDAGRNDAGRDNAGRIDAGQGDAGQGDGKDSDTAHGDALPSGGRESSRALTLAWVDGTYLSTSVAISRHERVGAAGMNVQAKANMVVDDSSVRWEREKLGEVRVAGSRLLAVSTRRSLADMLMGHAEMVLVSWRAGTSSPLDNSVARADDNERDHRGEPKDSAEQTGGAEQRGGAEQTGDLCVTAFLPRSRTDSAALVSAVQRLMKMDGTP